MRIGCMQLSWLYTATKYSRESVYVEDTTNMPNLITEFFFYAGIIAGVIIAILILGYLLSEWLFPEVDLSTQATGNKNLDNAQKRVDSLDLELGIMEDLGTSVSPQTLNTLRGQLDRAEEILATEKEKAAMKPETVIAPEGVLDGINLHKTQSHKG